LGAVNLSLGGRFFENCVVYIGLESFFFFLIVFPRWLLVGLVSYSVFRLEPIREELNL
jgi:hypothetical protein